MVVGRWYAWGSGKVFIRHIRRTFIAGALLVLPVALTFLVLRFVFNSLDGLLQPAIRLVLDREVPGLGLAIEMVFIYLAGLLFANMVGRRVFGLGQALLHRLPIIGSVYGASRQLVESFSGPGNIGFKRVVLLEYPRTGTWTIGLLTAITTDGEGRSLAVVYVPTSPTPYTGWVAILPLQDVYDTNLTFQQAIQFCLSGGVVSPSRIITRRIEFSGPEVPSGTKANG